MPIPGNTAVPITVILPAYNAENTLANCLESIRRQNFGTFEIILINDGSTDQTGAIFDKFAREDRRARVVHMANAGVAAARNRGLDLAMGDFIFFIDADDTVSPEALSRLFEAQQSSGAPLVIGGFDRYGPSPMNSPDGLVFASNTGVCLPAICTYVCKYLDRPNKNPLFVFSWGALDISRDFKRDRNSVSGRPEADGRRQV